LHETDAEVEAIWLALQGAAVTLHLSSNLPLEGGWISIDPARNQYHFRHSRAGGNRAKKHSAKRTNAWFCPASRGVFNQLDSRLRGNDVLLHSCRINRRMWVQVGMTAQLKIRF